MIVFDCTCPYCNIREDRLAETADAVITCCECGTPMEKIEVVIGTLSKSHRVVNRATYHPNCHV